MKEKAQRELTRRIGNHDPMWFESYTTHFENGSAVWDYYYDPEPGETQSYGDFRPFGNADTGFKRSLELGNDPTFKDFVIPEVMTGSDYGGCNVTLANFEAFLERFEGVRGVWRLEGGWNTYAVAIRLNCPDPEVWDCLEALEDYPVVCEETLGEVDIRLQNEAWESWAQEDFVSALDLEEYELNEDTIYEVFHAACDRANEYWEYETGAQAWIRIENVVKEVTPAELATLKGS